MSKLQHLGLTCLGLTCLVLAAACLAPEQLFPQAAGRIDDRGISIDFRHAPLADVVAEMSRILRRPIAHEDPLLEEVTMVSEGQANLGQVVGIFDALLEAKGFEIIEAEDRGLRIRKLEDRAAQLPVRSAGPLGVETYTEWDGATAAVLAALGALVVTSVIGYAGHAVRRSEKRPS